MFVAATAQPPPTALRVPLVTVLDLVELVSELQSSGWPMFIDRELIGMCGKLMTLARAQLKKKASFATDELPFPQLWSLDWIVDTTPPHALHTSASVYAWVA
jgi:hypothetical protein